MIISIPMTLLELTIDKLPKVGPRNVPRMRRLGIVTIGDLLRHFPARYEDLSSVVAIEDILVGDNKEKRNVIGTISEVENVRLWKSRRYLTKAFIEDSWGMIKIVWFNQPYLADTLKVGTQVSLAGKIAFDKEGPYLSNPSYEKISSPEASRTHTGGLIPVYPETYGITSKYLRFLIKPILAKLQSLLDPLPPEMIKKYELPSLKQALLDIHFPRDIKDAERARKRMTFEELFLFQLQALQNRRKLNSLNAPKINFDEKLVAEFVTTLPFKLTDDQRVATYEVLQDLGRDYPMNRLLNGDVGSGKTIVGLIAAYQTVNIGYQTVIMAPTEILAKQHFETAKKIYGDRVRAGLLTSKDARQWPVDVTSHANLAKKIMLQKIVRGELDLIIGTHAVIQKNVSFKK